MRRDTSHVFTYFRFRWREERHLGQIDGMLQTVENQLDTLHNAKDTKLIFDVMQKALKELNNYRISIEDVQQLQDDLEEQRDISKRTIRSFTNSN